MKRTILFLLMIMMMSCLLGCSFFGLAEEDDLELTEEDYQAASMTLPPAVSEGSVDVMDVISIYTIDGIEETLVPLNVAVHTERITPEFILDEVIRNLDEKVDVTEIEIEKKRIYITFNEEYAPVKNCSEGYETLILDCVSNSILDNISYVEEVVFRSGEDAYHSKNFTFEKDEVYSSK